MNKIIPVILLMAIGGFFYTTLSKVNKSSINSKRVACQTKTETSEKVFVHNPVIEAISLLQSKNFTLQTNNETVKQNLEHILSTYVEEEKSSEQKVLIDLSIYENKEVTQKVPTGELVFEFKLDNKPVYKMKTKYSNKNEFNERLTCAFDSFVSLK